MEEKRTCSNVTSQHEGAAMDVHLSKTKLNKSKQNTGNSKNTKNTKNFKRSKCKLTGAYHNRKSWIVRGGRKFRSVNGEVETIL